MNNNIVPSLIIAVAMVTCCFLARSEIHQSLDVTPDGFLKGIEKLANEKDEKGEMAIKASVGKIVEGIAAGVKSGFETGTKSNHTDYSKLTVSQITFVSGRMDNEERIIGIIHNSSDVSYADLSLSAIVRDKEGNLIDVKNDFTRIKGVLAPGKDIGFSIDRQVRPFGDEDKKAGVKAANASITITEGEIVK